MKITNKLNLPSALVNLANDVYEPKEKRYSVTTLLSPTRQILLGRRHFNEIEFDVSDMVWLILGTAVHKILESHDKTGYAEMYMSKNIIDDYILTGKMDLYNEVDFSSEDYKTASVWKVINKDFEDWRKQGLMYAYLSGKYVDKLRFHAILKDWTANEKRKRGEEYPEHSIWTWEYKVTTQDMIEIEQFIKSKFEDLIRSEQYSDGMLPPCSQEERWNAGSKFVVMKKGQVRAVRVLDTEQEANDYLKNKGGDYIVERKGEDRKCRDYCDVNKFCSYWQEHQNDVATDD